MIFIFRKWCRPKIHWYPTLSAEKSGKDGARKSTANAKMLQGSEAHLYLAAFMARDPEGTPVVPCYKATTH